MLHNIIINYKLKYIIFLFIIIFKFFIFISHMSERDRGNGSAGTLVMYHTG